MSERILPWTNEHNDTWWWETWLCRCEKRPWMRHSRRCERVSLRLDRAGKFPDGSWIPVSSSYFFQHHPEMEQRWALTIQLARRDRLTRTLVVPGKPDLTHEEAEAWARDFRDRDQLLVVLAREEVLQKL